LRALGDGEASISRNFDASCAAAAVIHEVTVILLGLVHRISGLQRFEGFQDGLKEFQELQGS